jgi:hypothetical protein
VARAQSLQFGLFQELWKLWPWLSKGPCVPFPLPLQPPVGTLTHFALRHHPGARRWAPTLGRPKDSVPSSLWSPRKLPPMASRPQAGGAQLYQAPAGSHILVPHGTRISSLLQPQVHLQSDVAWREMGPQGGAGKGLKVGALEAPGGGCGLARCDLYPSSHDSSACSRTSGRAKVRRAVVLVVLVCMSGRQVEEEFQGSRDQWV